MHRDRHADRGESDRVVSRQGRPHAHQSWWILHTHTKTLALGLERERERGRASYITSAREDTAFASRGIERHAFGPALCRSAYQRLVGLLHRHSNPRDSGAVRTQGDLTSFHGFHGIPLRTLKVPMSLRPCSQLRSASFLTHHAGHGQRQWDKTSDRRDDRRVVAFTARWANRRCHSLERATGQTQTPICFAE